MVPSSGPPRPCPPLLLLLVAAAAAGGIGRVCGPTGLPKDTVLGLLGANLTLRCQVQHPPPNATLSWQRGGRGEPVVALGGGNELVLRGLRYEDSGRYSCHGEGGHPLRSLHLLVEAPPETPLLSCHRRSHDRALLCQWAPQKRPSPGTRATLWVRRRFLAENSTAQRCRHFARSQQFVCRVPVPAGTQDTQPLLVSVCASNAAGGAAGSSTITLRGALKPDPPRNVTVVALEGAPRRLRVTWSYPASWDPRFYWLRFQVRYRPESTPSFTEVDEVLEPRLDIADAWAGARHRVQVRAQDEFGHGSWSDWSPEALGTPWTGPSATSAAGTPSSQVPPDGSTRVTLPPELWAVDDAGAELGAVGHPPAPTGAILGGGGSLVLGITLVVGIAVRYRQTGRRKGRRGGPKAEDGGQQQVLVPLSPTPGSPISETPLLPPPADPPAPLHVTNLDYFVSRR